MLPRYLKFALKSSVSVAKSAQKKHEMIGWTPQIDCHSLLSTIMQNKKLQIVLCHKRIISSKFKIFKKKSYPQKPLCIQLQTLLKLLLTFEIFFTRTRNFSLPGTEKQKKWCAYNQFHLTIPLFMDVFFVAAFFLSGCHILIENSAIFITKMQWILWKKFDCNFWTQTRKNFQNNTKCYTTSIFILSQQKIFKGLF